MKKFSKKVKKMTKVFAGKKKDGYALDKQKSN